MSKVILMSGVPGSGKSTLVRELYRDAKVCSADHHFTDSDGAYHFNPCLLGEAHAACMKRFIDGLEDGVDTIVVDNTNTTELELAPYVQVAAAYGVKAHIVTVLCDPEVAAARNTHGVPVNAVKAMDQRLRARKLPPFWDVTLETIGQ